MGIGLVDGSGNSLEKKDGGDNTKPKTRPDLSGKEIFTNEEASSKICPFRALGAQMAVAVAGVAATATRSVSTPPNTPIGCAGELCMMWRHSTATEFGRCAMAGSPQG